MPTGVAVAVALASDVSVGVAGSVVIKGVEAAEEGTGVDRAVDRAVGEAAGVFTGEAVVKARGDTVGEGAVVPGAAGMGASGVGGT